MADEIGRIVADLPGQHETNSVWQLAKCRIAVGDADFVARLGIAVAEEGASLRLVQL